MKGVLPVHRAPPGRRCPHHLDRALKNGVTQTELLEAITQLAFYGGWPKATAVTIARQLFGASEPETEGEDQIGGGADRAQTD